MRLRIPRLDRIVGMTIPLGIFIEAGSPILLATSRIAQENLAVPLSFLLFPFVIAVGAIRIAQKQSNSVNLGILAISPFALYTVILASASAIFINPMAFIYGIQWILPFPWIVYFLSMNKRNFYQLADGFVYGSFIGAFYYFLAGALEIAQYGALLDFGRLTQNLILPGQYQIAVYVPTALAYSTLLSTVFIKSSITPRSRSFLIILNIFAFIAISFTASREGMLVFVVGQLLIAAVERPTKMALLLVTTAIVSIIASLNIDQILSYFSDSELRLLNKLSALNDSTNIMAGRDDMINDVLQILRSNILFGTHFLPPQHFNEIYAVSAPSAHNIYVDVFLWTGVFGGILFLVFSIAFLLHASKNIYTHFFTRTDIALASTAVLGIMFILLSNNVNVPWRQPLTSPLGALLFALCVNSRLLGKK